MPIRIENNQITILSPATLKEVGQVSVTKNEDVETTLNIAKEYSEWSSLSFSQIIDKRLIMSGLAVHPSISL